MATATAHNLRAPQAQHVQDYLTTARRTWESALAASTTAALTFTTPQTEEEGLDHA